MRRPRKSINQINVVPYIDVMLVLLVIFMITAPLITPGEITLPSVGSVLTTPVAPMQIQIKRDATLLLKEGTASPVRVSRDELIARIQARQKQSPEQAVVIAADSDVRYEAVVAVLDMLQRNKVSKVGLLARRQPG
jgi:biopolymer transport protein TolR